MTTTIVKGYKVVIGELGNKAEEWMVNYNYNRPHKSLNYKTPMDLLPEIIYS